MERNILITETDMDRLQKLVDGQRLSWKRDLHLLDKLEEELDRAKIVDGSHVPPDVVTMNSLVRVTDLSNRKSATYQLVFPHDANVDENKISVLAPIGMAMLGYRVGNKIEWEVPGGMRRLRIDAVDFQPERKKADRAIEVANA